MTLRGRHFSAAHMFSRLLRLLIPALLVAVAARNADAQDDYLREGVRVRIDTRSSRQVVGVVRSFDTDSVRLYTDVNGATLSVARNDITGIRVSQGKSATRGAIRGAAWGTAIGALAAAIVVVAVKADDTYAATDDEVTYVVANSLAGGALWGAGIGAFVKSEQWQRISMKPRATGSQSGVRLGLTLQSAWLH